MTPAHVLEARLGRLEREAEASRRILTGLAGVVSFSCGATAACVAALAEAEGKLESSGRFAGVLERLKQADELLTQVAGLLGVPPQPEENQP